MKVLLGLLAGLAAFFLLPATAMAYPAQCPLYSSAAGKRIVTAEDYCSHIPAFALDNIAKAGKTSRIQSGEFIFFPSIQQGQAAQNANTERTGIDLVKARNQGEYYTVQPGDSLERIAETHNTTIDALVLANPHVTSPDLIHNNDQLRIPSPAETERLSSDAAKRRLETQRQIVANTPHGDQRWVDVDLYTQTVRVYDGDTLVRTFLASTGIAKYPTVTGRFHVWLKLEKDDMRGQGYDLKDVPYVLYFYKDYALHGTYWHHNFGTPMSHGCVNLRTADAAWLYNFGIEGMLVNVH